MLTNEQNTLLTRIGRGTPMGGLIRRYWIPALFAEQLPGPDCDPVRVKLLGESLVAFRDTLGRIGLLQEHCPHRTASLFFGRNEDCGLRCIYHGWKFDVEGNCVDLPTEPATSTLKQRVKATAYPCIERGGLIWTYMGPRERQPDFPAIEWTELPPSHRRISRRLQECNWLQALEGGFDSTHLSFLHQGDLSFAHPLPSDFEFKITDSGFICGYGREIDGRMMWSSDTLLMPFHKLIGTTLPGAHTWVPVDDETTLLYSVDYNPEAPLTEEQHAAYASGDRMHAHNAADSERMAQNRDNNYGVDRARQRSGQSFSGIRGIGVQDTAIQESMGSIADRSQENLGVGDLSIVQLRRYLLRAVEDYQAGRDIPAQRTQAYRLRPLCSFTPKGPTLNEIMDRHLDAMSALTGSQ
jgi:phthalate 4,5-dioxygenase oxygenase subunit